MAFDTPGERMLLDRKDLGVLWDIRVRPEYRHLGIGTRLFGHATEWLRDRGGTVMKVETQNVNVPACRFYAKQGCLLGEVNRYAYAGHPRVCHETLLVWYLDV